MVSNQKLFSVGNFDFRLQHLLVIGVLILSFSISFIIRSGPTNYATELFEYDPFFNVRATEYVIDNGFIEYLNWVDEKSWHPFGRDVSNTSQVTLHFTTAILYQIFNFGSSVYIFSIFFPLVIGSLTGIVVFAFVRVLGGTSAGLFASLMFAVSVPIFSRGYVGWFKSEPLGLFFGFLAFYLFVSGIKFNNRKTSFLKLLCGGFFLALALSSWGGAIFFLVGISIFYFALPFFKQEKNFLFWAIPTFSISIGLSSLIFERTTDTLFGVGGTVLLLSTIFVLCTELIKKYSVKNSIRNSIIFLASIIALGLGIIFSGSVSLPSFRYLNAVNPLLLAEDALTDSVAEHQTVNLDMSFTVLSVFIIFGLVGVWLLFSKKYPNIKNDMKAFSLIIAFLGIYLSSAFMRLELFASVALLIVGGIGLSLLYQEVFKIKKSTIKYIFSIVIICLFVIPVALPENLGWAYWTDFSPTIMNGGTGYRNLVSNDWFEATEWIKENTPENSVIAAWWDYGYWITTLSDRTTIIDNATLIDWQIEKMAYVLLASPDQSWNILNSDYNTDVSDSMNDEFLLKTIGKSWTTGLDGYLNDKKQNPELYDESCTQIFKAEAKRLGIPERSCDPIRKGMGADYILIFVTAEKIPTHDLDFSLYSLNAGGDESKKHWFAEISENDPLKFVLNDGRTPTSYFMNNTTLGKLTPFSIALYVDMATSKTYENYSPGLIPIYTKTIKFIDPENDPFVLVYASPSFYSEMPGQQNMILVYKINPDYKS